MKKNIIESLIKYEVFGAHTQGIVDKLQHQGRVHRLIKEEAKSIMKTLLSPPIDMAKQGVIEQCCFQLTAILYPQAFRAMVLHHQSILELVVAYTHHEPVWQQLGKMRFTGEQMKFFPFGFGQDNTLPNSSILLLCLTNQWPLALPEISALYPEENFIHHNANQIFERVAQSLASAPEGTQIHEQAFIDYYMIFQLNFALFASRYSIMNISTIVHLRPNINEHQLSFLSLQLGFARQNPAYNKKVKKKRHAKYKGRQIKKRASQTCYLLKNYEVDREYQESCGVTEHALAHGKGGLFDRTVVLRNQFKKETEEHNLNVALIKGIIDNKARYLEMNVFQIAEVIARFATRLIHFNDQYIFRITLLNVHLFVDEAFRHLAEHAQSITQTEDWMLKPFKNAKQLLLEANEVLRQLPDEQIHTRTILLGRVTFLLSLIHEYDKTVDQIKTQMHQKKRAQDHEKAQRALISANQKIAKAVEERRDLVAQFAASEDHLQCLKGEYQELNQQKNQLQTELNEHQNHAALSIKKQQLISQKSKKQRVILNSAKAITTYISGALIDDLTIEKVETVVTDFEQFCVDISEQWQDRLLRIEKANQKKYFVRMLLLRLGVPVDALRSLPDHLNALCDFTEHTDHVLVQQRIRFHYDWSAFFQQGCYVHQLQSQPTVAVNDPEYQLNDSGNQAQLLSNEDHLIEEAHSQISEEDDHGTKERSNDLTSALNQLRYLRHEVNELKSQIKEGHEQQESFHAKIQQNKEAIEVLKDKLSRCQKTTTEDFLVLHNELNDLMMSIGHLNQLKTRIHSCCNAFYQRGNIDEKITQTFEVINGRRAMLDEWQQQKESVQARMQDIKIRMSLISGLNDRLTQEELINGLAMKLHCSIDEIRSIHRSFHQAYAAGFHQEAMRSLERSTLPQ